MTLMHVFKSNETHYHISEFQLYIKSDFITVKLSFYIIEKLRKVNA